MLPPRRFALPRGAIVALAGLVALSCERSTTETASRSASATAAPIGPDLARSEAAPSCADPIPVFDEAKSVRSICAAAAPAAGLTVLDLSDDWAPRILGEAPELGRAGAQAWRTAYVALANERFGDGPEFDRPKRDRYLELYGVSPTLSVVRARLFDRERHLCRASVDGADLAGLDRAIDPWRDKAKQRSDKAFSRTLLRRLEAERAARGAASLEAMRQDGSAASLFRQYDDASTPSRAIAAAQAQLACDGLLEGRFEPGISDYATTEALRAFQRKQMIVSWQLDPETARALVTDSRELDFRALLRALRERVVDATALLEDGSARGEPGRVLDRDIDGDAFRRLEDRGPALENGAPDRVSAATEAAALALGWTSPDAATAFLEALEPAALARFRVAVRLPPLPRYHGPKMELRAVIDRGDVSYDSPYERAASHAAERPSITLYAKDGDGEVALARWQTTVGGWKPEKVGFRKMGLVFKDSPPGERIWRDVIAAPVWVPPENAPKRDLVRPRATLRNPRRGTGGGWAVKSDLFGPGYASAYGLVMMVHHRVPKTSQPGLALPLRDEGVRTHGSVSYDSIDHGTSHGCHRLYNHMAVRLGGFLLAHREHVRHGEIDLGYARSFVWEGRSMDLRFPSRGYRYELTPPVPVEVTKGKILSRRTAPPTGTEVLPPHLAERFTQERFE